MANTRVVGAILAKLVLTLVDKAGLKLRDLHVIGHSLGAHVSGYVGRRLPGIARITGKVHVINALEKEINLKIYIFHTH